jgi:putative ABC transport system permease protein
MSAASADVVVLREVVIDAAGSLLALKGRTLLALIGIAIGTAAVIAMLHIGSNARSEALHQFEALGTDLVNIVPTSDASARTIIPADAPRALLAAGVGISEVAPFIQGGTTLRVGRASISASLVAAADGIYSLARAELADGRRTSDLDGNASFAVLGADLAHDIGGATGRRLRIGDQIIADDHPITIVGVLQARAFNPILGLDLNRTVIVPLGSARRFMPDPQITNIAARLAAGADDLATAAAVRTYFAARIRGGNVHVQTARELIAGVDRQMRVYGLLLLAIGAVSLVVGGVGVMNVMLMSVMERRQEIGLRLAIGAQRRDVRAMFLIEALILSGAGSFAGTLLGTLAGWIFAHLSGWHFEAAPAALPLAIGMTLVVGLFFGSYPAARAARLDPIVALNSR